MYTCAAKAMHLDTRRPLSAIRVVIIPNFWYWTKLFSSSILVSTPGSSLFFALYLS